MYIHLLLVVFIISRVNLTDGKNVTNQESEQFYA